MRMWMVNPEILCRKHLLGEHVELHMLVGCIIKGKSIQGYLDTGLVETGSIYRRHNELTKEIKRRGYNHKSPLEITEKVYPARGKVNVTKSLEDLSQRCKECTLRNG